MYVSYANHWGSRVDIYCKVSILTVKRDAIAYVDILEQNM